jgi:hypothetical protein
VALKEKKDGLDLCQRALQSQRREPPQGFATADAARAWFVEHDPEGVAFEFPVLS